MADSTGWNLGGHDGRAVYIPIAIWECRRCGARWNVAGRPATNCPMAATGGSEPRGN